MNILMVCPDWFPFSAGLSQSCHALCKEFEAHGHNVRVLVADDGNVEKKGLNVHPIPYLFRILGRSPVLWNPWKKIKNHIKWCDTVCLFSYMYVMNSQIVKLRSKGKFDKPLIHFYRGSLEDGVLNQVSLPVRIAKWVYDRTVGKRMFTEVDHIISNAKSVLSLITEKYGVSKEKMTYVKNALHVNEFDALKEKKKRVIFIGRLIENKGVKLFKDISEVVPDDWEFVIVGDGPMRQHVENIAKNKNNVVYKGRETYENTKKILSESSILALPSFAEGSPRVVMEASACGISSIAFNVGDVDQTIPEDCGYVIPAFDKKEFVLKVKELIHDTEDRISKGINARKFAEKELDWSINYPKIEEKIEEVVGK